MIGFDGAARFLAARGPVTAVRRWGVPVAAADALGAHEARTILYGLQREGSRLALLALYTLSTGLEADTPSRVDSNRLVAAIEAAFEARTVLLFTGWGPGAMMAPREAGGHAAGVGEVAALMRDRAELSFEGRRYRLVPAAAMDGRREVDGYSRMSAADARQTVDRIAARFAAGQEDRDRWTRAAALLDLPREREKLVLLRFVPAGGGSRPADAAPAATPSQVRAQIAAEFWIEIEIVYDDGTRFDGSCKLELPGGRSTNGAPDENGLLRVDHLSSGSCKLSFPDLDAETFNLG